MVSACKVLQCSRIFKRSDLLVARQLVGVLNLSNTDIPFQSSLQFLVLCSMPLAGTPVNLKKNEHLGFPLLQVYLCLSLLGNDLFALCKISLNMWHEVVDSLPPKPHYNMCFQV